MCEEIRVVTHEHAQIEVWCRKKMKTKGGTNEEVFDRAHRGTTSCD
jgi:hypothetical protein